MSPERLLVWLIVIAVAVALIALLFSLAGHPL